MIINGYEIAGRSPLFKPDMRRAIRTGAKTQTRRVVKDAHPDKLGDTDCLYGKPGDIMVMREPLYCTCEDDTAYLDDFNLVKVSGKNVPWRWKVKKLSSIFMPTECGRTLLRYTGIRIERLQDITENDAEAEGLELWQDTFFPDYSEPGMWLRDAVDSFRTLWDSINAQRGYPWETNPWVWVIEFYVLDV